MIGEGEIKIMKRKQMKKQILTSIPIMIGIVLLILFIYIRFSNASEKGKEKILTSSTLTDTIDISELSASQFTYNGIAEVKEGKKGKIKCYVRYNAKVKAGIDMKDVKWEIDNDKKTIKPILPPIEINTSAVDDSEFSFIPEDTSVELNTILTVCEKDSEREAMESKELLKSAEDNLKSIIEGLLKPVITPQGYKVIW